MKSLAAKAVGGVDVSKGIIHGSRLQSVNHNHCVNQVTVQEATAVNKSHPRPKANDMRQKVGGHCCFWGAFNQDQVWDRNQF